MENNPPPSTRPPFSLMHSRPHSKSSPMRDTTRVLTPQLNHLPPPSDDVFQTGLLTPQASQNTVDMDAAKSLISPPPEGNAQAGTSRQHTRWSRAGSEPTSSSRRASNAGSSSKRKRSAFPSHSLQDSRAMIEASPNPRSRKQTRTAAACSETEEHSQAHLASPVRRKQRQSHAPPPEGVDSHLLRRSRTPSLSPTKSQRDPALLRSPHAGNAKADYIPPVPSHARQHLSARARSSTPAPPYEPPTEQFTPPREVMISSPRVSKSSKRKKVFKVVIKKEPPEIDLSRPPPPSPTDDPILLRARLRPPRPSIPTHARETPLLESTPPGPSKQTSPLNRSALDFPLPGIPSDVEDNDDPDVPEQPVFNFAGAGDDAWSSSNEGESEQEGEYTGKFRVVRVPTKADPPTSTTRERIEQWGRPLSPFPRKVGAILEGDAHSDVEENSDVDLPLAQPRFSNQQNEDGHVPETLGDAGQPSSQSEVHQEGFTVIEHPEMGECVLADDLTYESRVTPPIPIEAAHCDQEGDVENKDTQGSPTSPQEDVVAGDGERVYQGQNENAPAEEWRETVATPQDDDLNSVSIHHDISPSEVVGEEQTDEVFVEHALSEEPQPFTPSQPQTPGSQAALNERIEADEPMPETVDAESDEDSSDESDLSVVKIVSDDPWAAARAAAILKQHDWDLVTKIARNRRLSPRTVESLIRNTRRADLASAGISKSSSPARSGRRSFGVVVDGRVVTANSPSMTLPELLSEAESELDAPTFLKRGQYTPRTPSPAPASFRRPEAPLVIDTDGPREWSRSDWKLLDACFTDVRLEIGARWGSEGTLGDVDAVELEDVVERFVDIFGGEEVVSGLGPSFDRPDMLKRAKALQRKQRAGEGAPPTPTLRVSSIASSTPTVPDFTPVHFARRQGVDSTLPKLAAPAFLGQTTPRLPASLMAPRYSHLLEEAKTLSKQDDARSCPPEDEQTQEVPPTPSVGSRMKGFLFSYLPTLKKKTPARKTCEPARPGLPLPPPEMMDKSRGPVITPQPKPVPRPTHPKELVNLQHAPLPTSRIPTLSQIPKRLVELRPVSPPPAASAPIQIPDGRRSSSGSVKDLVNSFEEMERSREIDERALQLRRQKSAGRLAAGGTKVAVTTSSKPGVEVKERVDGSLLLYLCTLRFWMI
ncbi:hypothetical protein BJY52DRAFT_406246 [Lactarius psammicola]|nr:hypothetical protein BJY52DRAFT_406246 [Lactarius psammicola]